MLAHNTNGVPPQSTIAINAGFAGRSGSPLARLAGAAVPAAIISLGLLFVMHLLIGSGEWHPGIPHPVPTVITSFQDEQKIEIKDEIELPVRETVEHPPVPDTFDPDFADSGSGIEYTSEGPGDDGTELITDVAYVSNRGAYPIFRVQPQFPSRAPANGGCVEVGFTITAVGSVANAVVLNSSNSRFDKYALKAVNQFKYKPWISNGRAVPTPGQSIRLVWQYEDTPLVNHSACTD